MNFVNVEAVTAEFDIAKLEVSSLAISNSAVTASTLTKFMAEFLGSAIFAGGIHRLCLRPANLVKLAGFKYTGFIAIADFHYPDLGAEHMFKDSFCNRVAAFRIGNQIMVVQARCSVDFADAAIFCAERAGDIMANQVHAG